MIKPFSPYPPPPPMHEIGSALLHIADAREALSRPHWNSSQLDDALTSAEHFIAKARAALAKVQA